MMSTTNSDLAIVTQNKVSAREIITQFALVAKLQLRLNQVFLWTNIFIPPILTSSAITRRFDKILTLVIEPKLEVFFSLV